MNIKRGGTTNTKEKQTLSEKKWQDNDFITDLERTSQVSAEPWRASGRLKSM
jgi:hypothetical protein